VESAIEPPLPSIDTPRCDLRPSPGIASAANEEKREVLLRLQSMPYGLMEPC
jgi:hypothetical protein